MKMVQEERPLLPGEGIVMASTDGALVLTNVRVKYEGKNERGRTYRSILLNKVSGCSVETKSYPLLLFFAAVAVVSIFVSPTDQARIISVAVTMIFVISYFLTRNGWLEIFSDSGDSIAVPTKGMKHEVARGFVEAVTLAVVRQRLHS